MTFFFAAQPEKPEPPPRRRPAPKKAAGDVSARKVLCQRLLTPVLSAVKRRCGRLLDPFKVSAVSNLDLQNIKGSCTTCTILLESLQQPYV